MQDGNQFAGRLGLTAGLYSDTENEITGSLKDLITAAVGDPHMTGHAPWSQDTAMITGAHTQGGGMTWGQAEDAMKQQWESVGHDALNTTPAKTIKDMLDDCSETPFM